MAVQQSDIAVVGHFSVDTLVLPTRKQPFQVLGGPAAYTSFAAKHLGASACVFSKVGADFPEAYLWWVEQEGINIKNVSRHSEATTTRFELTYTKDFVDRTLKLKSKGPPLAIDDLPKDFHANAVHLAPIDNEISYDVAEELKKYSDVVSLDLQGLLRSFDAEGNVSDNFEVDNRIFSLINILKASQSEIYALTGEPELKPAIRAIHDVGVETVILTMGSKGSVLSVEGAQYTIPACTSAVLVDPTGAGDVFIGAFLTEYLQQKESLWCATVGSATASFVVEGLGPTYFGKKDEVYQRAKFLYEKELKQ
jgi:sugar/nucleoside kinase (ribokinase family)